MFCLQLLYVQLELGSLSFLPLPYSLDDFIVLLLLFDLASYSYVPCPSASRSCAEVICQRVGTVNCYAFTSLNASIYFQDGQCVRTECHCCSQCILSFLSSSSPLYLSRVKHRPDFPCAVSSFSLSFPFLAACYLFSLLTSFSPGCSSPFLPFVSSSGTPCDPGKLCYHKGCTLASAVNPYSWFRNASCPCNVDCINSITYEVVDDKVRDLA